MSGPFEVAVLVGSLRRLSFSSRVAAAFQEIARERLRCRDVSIGDLPLYNEDRDGDNAPSAYKPFRESIAAADAVLFVSPEYNRSIPGALKNAIDIASRPGGKGAILGKPAAIISQSPSPTGGFGANHIIRQSLVSLSMPVVQTPELYLGQIADALDENGSVANDRVREQMSKLVVAFADLIARSKRDHSEG